MMHAPQPERGGGDAGRQVLTSIALLWLAGNGLRLTILAVPPLIPAIHDEFRMSETQVGILAGLPVVLFAFAAIPGSMLIARFGALTTAIIGLVVTGLRVRAARSGARRVDALRRDHRDRLRRRGDAAVDAAAGAGLAARPHRLRHRGLHQRTDRRRNPARCADDPGGAAAASAAAGGSPSSPGACPASRSRRLSMLWRRVRRRRRSIPRCRGSGGRTGRARCCGGSA